MRAESAQRITFVANELLGFRPAGGLGTATTFLALALARAGHSTQILYYGRHALPSMDPSWTGVYASGGVGIVRVLQPETVEPFHFRRMRGIELALRADPPDVVIAQDLGAPAYSALRLRHLGLAFPDTVFVVFCHGTRRWVTEMSRKLHVTNLHDLLSVSLLEQAAIELADVVVSPSAYLVRWMRAQGWRLPERALVIPYVTRSGAAGQPPPALRAAAGRDGPVERLAFFGRLEQKKGVEAFADGLNRLDPELIEGLELEFLGKATPAWPPERVDALLSPNAKRAFRRVSFETALDQPEVIARLGRRGTLAVVPSLGDNSPNTVYECLEHGIPFVASHVGGIGELVAPEDRERVLFEPTPEGVAAALRRALSDRGALRPARASFDDTVSLQRWEEVLAMRPRAVTPSGERPRVDVVVVYRQSRDALARCLEALAKQAYRELTVTVAAIEADLPADDLEAPVVRSERCSVEAAREAGLEAGTAAWVVFLDEEDVPEPDLLETLVRAQAASGADAVSCGLYLSGEGSLPIEHFFAGDPGGLGVLANGYGTVALVRRSLLGHVVSRWPVEADPDWPLLARLAARARIVSVPLPLVTRAARPEAIDGQPGDALLVVEQLERGLPDHLRSLARLAAGLAAEMNRPSPAPTVGLARHAVRVREEGFELARRGFRRLSGGAR